MAKHAYSRYSIYGNPERDRLLAVSAGDDRLALAGLEADAPGHGLLGRDGRGQRARQNQGPGKEPNGS